MTRCSIAGCEQAKIARGWCRRHYYRWIRNGDPCGGRTAPGVPMQWLQKHATYRGDECLIWPFRRGGRGYAYLKNAPACRTMCELSRGPAPSPSHEVAHSCGSGHLGCINPRHLRWATKSENEADKRKHGTLRRGSKIAWAKLTEADVYMIRCISRSQPEHITASIFGVSRSTINLILNDKTWRHVS